MNSYIYVVKLTDGRYFLFRNCKEFIRFVKTIDFIIFNNITVDIKLFYKGFRPYYESRGFKYFYED